MTGGKLLIVDDTPANLDVLVGELDRRGYSVAVAQDGEEALARAAYVQPDLILLDVMMPGLDGFETCRQLKAVPQTSEIPVIFMTAVGDASSKVTGFGCGGADYVTKPFQLDEVVARIEMQLALRQALERLRESEERYRLLAETLQHQATHDPLTGLPNRTLLVDRLNQAIAAAKRRNAPFHVGFLDLDHFKRINDTLGHDAGDDLLRAVAARITNCLRASDTVARLGGDEFILLLQDFTGADDTKAVTQRVMAGIAEPIALGSHSVTVSCSIGCSRFPDDGGSADELLRAADAAMYRAKSARALG